MKPFGVQEVAREILSIWGEDAERICSRKAQEAESDGDQAQAAGWRRIRHEISCSKSGSFVGMRVHSK